MTTTVFEARRIITMHPARPSATHVAVREGRILAVDSAADITGWGPFETDTRFAQQVLMPGLVEGHSHLMAGTLWRYVYCGYFDATDPQGRVWPGLKTLDDVVGALAAAAASGPGSGNGAGNGAVASSGTADGAAAPVVGWGFDPIYFGDRRCSRGRRPAWSVCTAPRRGA